LRPIEALDEEKASLRVIELLYVRRGRDHPKMMLQRLAEFGGINKTKFNRAIRTLQYLGLLEEEIRNTPGKKGVSKHLKFSTAGVQVAEEVHRLLQLLREITVKTETESG
jgi:DNA-binding IclR family transcriptional regulator